MMPNEKETLNYTEQRVKSIYFLGKTDFKFDSSGKCEICDSERCFFHIYLYLSSHI